jgi:outer membrane lipoprotein LolB
MMRALALLAAAVLAGCARMPVGGDGLSFTERRAALETYDRWEMRGRLAVDTGERGFQGSFDWRQDDDTLELSIRGPLGNNVLRISGTPNELTVSARGETRRLEDPENQLSELVGWWLPVTSLPAWLRGLPDPGFPAATHPGADGTLASLEQRLWRLSFVSYQLNQSVLLPRRIDLAHGELALRVTIDRFAPAAPAVSALN